MFADIKSLEGKMKRNRFGQRVFVRVENRPRMDDLRLVITCACLSGLAFARIPIRYRLSGSPVLPEKPVFEVQAPLRTVVTFDHTPVNEL